MSEAASPAGVAQSATRVSLSIVELGGEPWVAADETGSSLDGDDLDVLRAVYRTLDAHDHFEMVQGADAAVHVADGRLEAVEADDEQWTVVAHDQLPACPDEIAVGLYTDDRVAELRPPGIN